MGNLTTNTAAATLNVSAEDRARTARQLRTQTSCCGSEGVRIVTSDRRLVKLAVASEAQRADMIAFVVCPRVGNPRIEGFAGGTGGCPSVYGSDGETLQSICARWWALAAEAVASEQVRAADPVAALRFELGRVDWNYQYTDDHSVWLAGRAQVEKVRRMALALPLETRLALWPRLSWAEPCPRHAHEGCTAN